jgi:hypothetical protein
MTPPDAGGPLADEAAQFAAAALGWAQRMAGGIDPGDERIATGSPECTVCPVCRAIHALRDPSPELAERVTKTVTDLAGGLAHALRVAFDGHRHPPADPDPDASATSGVQHIDIA